MLTKRQNLDETLKGGKPDRFVNQYEAYNIIFDPIMTHSPSPKPGELDVINDWGVYYSWEEGQPGGFPDNTPDHIVVKDIEHWRDYVKEPEVDYPEEAWQPFIAMAEGTDRSEQYLLNFQAPGLFENSHHLCEIKNILIGLYEYPDECKDLYKFLAEHELKRAERIIDHLHPDGCFHHDDWGSQISTFMSPAMFDEFLLEPYKEVYGYWHERGCDMIVHHSDSFAATLVPEMIEMGIQVWQGCMVENDLVTCIDKYGDKIGFMGGINDADIDFPGWTQEDIDREVRKACDNYGWKSFIPCTTHGLAMSVFPGVYDATTKAIDEYSPVYWKEHGLA